MIYSKCPLCSGTDLVKSLKVSDHLYSSDKFEIWSCSDCNFYFTQDAPGKDDIGKYYKSEDYISHSNSTRGLLNKAYQLARNIMLKRKYKHVRKSSGSKSGKILDIGCGTGHFLAYMKRKGWNSAGIEADPAAKGFAEEKFGLDVYSIEHISSFKENDFECVTLWHVLEHLHNPKSVLAEIHRILKSSGSCLIALPNNSSTDSQYYGENWAAWDVPRHLWHFNIPSFLELIHETGFHLRAVKRMPLDAFYISILSEKNKGSSLALIKGMLYGSYSWLVSLSKKSRSSSLIYILTKSD